MAIYATVGETGALTGFYDSALHDAIPDGAIELTQSQYQQWVTDQPGLIWTGSGLAAAPTPTPTPPTLAQQAQAAVDAGCQVTSSGTPAIDGTYAIDSASINKVMATSLYINVNDKFPAGQTQLAWPDISGKPHVFTTTDLFQSFATALADYVAHLDLVINGTLDTLPAQPVTIA